ncbi:MAG: helix-turn-helix domain-containing protein [Propionicimonas sp.]|uniref:helix-turn-helix domain-containing protein n=1 Tax=Propionicimonas sp. TaxID=1955623 RepID=UPI002B1FA4C0|nr:helix-turn-helix domain-containing protein [Propionicimonas sp.]MEA4944038.1 helix-turn-helix domain-containing protein [Propionicimonas sp.]MEA5052760.1 helix-turn-helix domain-containing protein [Propionicimonas sp.]MEA5116548.1 helix-turn-helix domain-containing protein [Propionicimonas sp.]
MAEMPYDEFVQLLNQARLDRHLSVRGAAHAANVAPATMQGWLNGRHVPTPALRPRYLAFLELLGIDEQLHPGFRPGER